MFRSGHCDSLCEEAPLYQSYKTILSSSLELCCTPRHSIGHWMVKIVTSVLEAILIIGSPLVELLCGSAIMRQSTLTHFYNLHTFVLPLLSVIFMLIHFPMICKQGISSKEDKS